MDVRRWLVGLAMLAVPSCRAVRAHVRLFDRAAECHYWPAA